MISNEVLQSERDIAEAIALEKVQIPNIPIVDYLQEGGDLISAVETDEAALKSVNIDWTKVMRLEGAIELLRDAQTAWMEERKDMEEARMQWKLIYPEALTLKKELLATMRFVYDGNKEALSRVSEITEGNGYADTIQDLHDIAYKAKTDLESFTSINYKVELFDKAEELSSQLMLLLSKMNGENIEGSQPKLFRDKAYTNLKDIVDYIRKYGKYVFRSNPIKITAYTSNYHKK